MNSILERRIEQFQSRIQQNINLADDELERLSNYLTLLRGEVVEANDQLTSVQRQITQATQQSRGRKKRIEASFGTVIAQLKTQHEAYVRELQEKNTAEIECIEKAYQAKLRDFENLAQRRIRAKVAPIADALDQTQRKRLSESVTLREKELEMASIEDLQSLQEIDINRQRRLESTIQARSQERLASLLQAKSKLSECVATLEEMERNHNTFCASSQSRLDNLDVRHRERVAREKERREREISSLTRKAEELHKKEKALNNTVQKIEGRLRMQIENAVKDGELLRREMSAKRDAPVDKGHEERLANWRQTLKGLRKKLELRESELLRARTDNESMKREIGRLKHEIRVAKWRRFERSDPEV
jgi:chromosome segregation ATPase